MEAYILKEIHGTYEPVAVRDEATKKNIVVRCLSNLFFLHVGYINFYL